MKKINDKILSIPPYVSTSWSNINTLHMKEIEGKPVLVVVLHNGTMIEVPHLEPSVVEQVFAAHGKFLEQETEQPSSDSLKHFEPNRDSSDVSFSFGLPFKLNGNEGIENLGAFLQHNPDQGDAPNLPPEIITKITSITKALGMDMEQMSIPKAEPHCNCVYCQIARAMQNGEQELEEEEPVSDEDLSFRDWEIKQEGDELYLVTNPLDKEEHYQVFLGNPVGCTCGQKNCEHIRMVLSS